MLHMYRLLKAIQFHDAILQMNKVNYVASVLYLIKYGVTGFCYQVKMKTIYNETSCVAVLEGKEIVAVLAFIVN